MKIAAAAYPLERCADWGAYAAKISAWVGEAAGHGAKLLVFPEYAAMELAAIGPQPQSADADQLLRRVSDLTPRAAALHAEIAVRHGVWILAGSGPVFSGNRAVNRAAFFGPDGPLGHQDKQILTRWERDPWRMLPGDGLNLFDVDGINAGVTICYDCEFPLLSRDICARGARLILAPSCTETEAGHARVRIAARARALENQCITVLSQTVGDAPWCPGLETSYGRAGLYGPPDNGFPSDGILAETAPNRTGWAIAEIDPDAVDRARADGQVLNFRHWSEQTDRLNSSGHT